MPSRGLTLTYRIIKALIRVAMLLLTRTSVRGTELMPRHGAAVVVCNHIAAGDPGGGGGGPSRAVGVVSEGEEHRRGRKIFFSFGWAVYPRGGQAGSEAPR